MAGNNPNLSSLPAGPEFLDLVDKTVVQSLAKLEENVEREIKNLDSVKSMNEDELESLRSRRLMALKKQAKRREEWVADGHGDYREIFGDKEFFGEVKGSERAVVHFYRPTTPHCDIVDKHLAELSRKHIETKFRKINAEKCPFVAERLKIWMLPSIVIIKNGQTKHTIVGLDEFGGTEDFETAVMSSVLAMHDAIFHRDLVSEQLKGRRAESATATSRITNSMGKLDEDDDWFD